MIYIGYCHLIVLLLALGVTYAAAGYSQFYVTPYSQNILQFAPHASPVLPLVHHTPFAARLHTPFLAPTYQAPSAFSTQSFSPFVHQRYSVSQPNPILSRGRNNNQIPTGRSLNLPQPEANQGLEYGFGYRTQFDDGASSMVVFVSGPEAQRLPGLRRNPASARKLASDILDSNGKEGANREIDNSLSNNITGFDFHSLFEVYPFFKELEQPKTNVLHLYSHPANVFPLILPTSTSSPVATSTSEEPTTTFASTNNEDSESITVESFTSSSSADAKEAESIIQETKVRINDIKSRNSGDTSQSSSSSTTTSSTLVSSTTTEVNTTIKDKAESTTSK